MADYMAGRYYRRRLQVLEELGGACAECGSASDLEIDHIDRSSKEVNIGTILASASEARYRAEVAKCQLLCSTCHRAKTARELGVPHGGGLSGKKNCKCAPCKQRKAEYNRNYHEAHRVDADSAPPMA
jgi:hypothetical protein